MTVELPSTPPPSGSTSSSSVGTTTTLTIKDPLTDKLEDRQPTLKESLTEIESTLKEPSPPTNNKVNKLGNVAFTAATTVLTAQEMTNTGIEMTKKILGDTTNPVLSNLIQLADKIVDIGKAVPIIAPAFVILKIIIDVEQKAREADEKCQDLLSRINFMISHLLVLEKIQVMEVLTQVLEKVQETLKEAASLIEAYRKQGKIARRLKMSNKENFESMAIKIASCSSDLMLSLQIQQTGDLEVLKKKVPRDLEAEVFVKENGGQDVINSNPELVKEFAKKMHLAMTDQVMEQMQTDLRQVLSETQHSIESLIQQSSTTNTAQLIKSLALETRQLEAERKLFCIQCESDYFVSTNHSTACGFHSKIGNDGYFSCCGRSIPCQQNFHQPDHHSNYRYSHFFPFAFSILEPKDTVDYWFKLQEHDFDKNGKIQTVRIGRLIRWKTWGTLVTRPLLLVNVGQVEDSLLYYLKVFTVEQLEEERKKVIESNQTLIFRNTANNSITDDSNAFAMAEWIIDQETEQLTGIKVTVKVGSSIQPTICKIPLDTKSFTTPNPETIEYLSKGGAEIFKPSTDYRFPETIQWGPTLKETRLREVEKFKTKTTLPVVLIPSGEMVANNNMMTARLDVDRFLGLWRGLNKSTLASQSQIIFLSAKAEFRLLGEKEYQPVETFGLRNGLQFPLTLAPSQAIDLPFEFTVKKPSQVIERSKMAINFAHLTIHHPLRVRITFTDLEGQECSLIQEYVHRVNGVTTRQPDEDLGYFFIDDIDLSERSLVTIKKSKYPKEYLVGICGGYDMTNRITVSQLYQIAKKAQREEITQVDMEIGADNFGLKWTCWALVDLNCCRVYGFKVVLEHGSATPNKYSATVGYAPCPLYGGDDLEIREIRYAEESVVVPKVEHRDPPVVVEYDDVDNDTAMEPYFPKVEQVEGKEKTVEVTEQEKVVVKVEQVKETMEEKEVEIADKTVDTTEENVVNLAISTSNSITTTNSTTMDDLMAKVLALEARLAASERQDALLNRILELEKKVEYSTTGSSSAAKNDLDAVHSRLESMDQKLETLNTTVKAMESNASRLATALEKIALVLSP